MAERDYKSTPVADALGLRAIIDGLASDLQDVRSGTITPIDAMARAALAKQIFNGCRLYLAALSVIGRKTSTQPEPEPRALDGAAIDPNE